MSRYIDRQIVITEGAGGGFKFLERLDELVQGYTNNLNDDLILIEFDDLKVKFCYGDQECKKQD